MIFHEEFARGELCGPTERDSHGEAHPAHDDWDGFRLLLVDQGAPDETLFARDVQLQAHAHREKIESFPEDQFFM
jgi:hypothetical protein